MVFTFHALPAPSGARCGRSLTASAPLLTDTLRAVRFPQKYVADIAIGFDGKVAAIGESLAGTGAKEIDATDKASLSLHKQPSSCL